MKQMIEVTKDDFYSAIGGPENIHPKSEPHRTIWEDLRSGEIVGRTAQGYVPRRGETDSYYLNNEFAARKSINGKN